MVIIIGYSAGMFDKDGNETVDINEFGHLFNYVNTWISVFNKYDANKSSSIDAEELQKGETLLLTFILREFNVSRCLSATNSTTHAVAFQTTS